MAPESRGRREQQRRARAHEAARRAADAQRRRTRVVALVVAALLVLSLVAGALAVAFGGDDATSPTTTTPTTAATGAATGDYPATGTPAAAVAPGATLTGPTPCPAEDGSSPRTTAFAEPPPLCIDPDRFYTAVVTTSAGPLTFQVNPRRALQSANAFVVLSRYHFYDGQAINRIEPRAWFEVGALFTGDQPSGFAIPDENPPQGQIFTPGTIAMVGEAGAPGTNRGELLVATLDQAPRISDEVSSFGILLDGAPTLAAIDRAASQDGLPTAAITVESVTITPGTPIG